MKVHYLHQFCGGDGLVNKKKQNVLGTRLKSLVHIVLHQHTALTNPMGGETSWGKFNPMNHFNTYRNMNREFLESEPNITSPVNTSNTLCVQY